jgi:hypothetical protein
MVVYLVSFAVIHVCVISFTVEYISFYYTFAMNIPAFARLQTSTGDCALHIYPQMMENSFCELIFSGWLLEVIVVAFPGSTHSSTSL